MRLHKQNDTTKSIVFLLVSAADHITPVTGAIPTVTISKNGAAFAAAGGIVTEVANGWYKLTPATTDVDTLGPLLIHASATGADPVDMEYQVVAFDPYSSVSLGLTNLDATISSRQPSGPVDLNVDQSTVTIGTVNALGAQAKADVNAEVDAALDTAIPATPTAGSVNEHVKALTPARAANLDNADVATSTRQPAGAVDLNADQSTVTIGTVANEVLANVTKINGDANAAARLALSAANMVPGNVVTGATTTSIPTDLTEATNDHYSGRIVLFTSGTLTGQVTDVTAYDGATKTLTVTALTEAPANGDSFLLV